MPTTPAPLPEELASSPYAGGIAAAAARAKAGSEYVRPPGEGLPAEVVAAKGPLYEQNQARAAAMEAKEKRRGRRPS
jgi:hypothetical protein